MKDEDATTRPKSSGFNDIVQAAIDLNFIEICDRKETAEKKCIDLEALVKEKGTKFRD